MGSNRRRIAMGIHECLRGGSLASRSASKALRLAGEERVDELEELHRVEALEAHGAARGLEGVLLHGAHSLGVET